VSHYFYQQLFLTDILTLKDCNMIISPSKLFSTGLLSLAFLFSNIVFSAPVIDSPEQERVGMSVVFDAGRSDVGTITDYNWEIKLKNKNVAAETFTKTTPTLSHTFNEIGEYKITLTVNGINLVKFITILDANAPFIAETATFSTLASVGGSYKTGDVVTFKSTDLAGNNNWDFGDLANARLNSQQTPKVLTVEIGSNGVNGKLSTVTHKFLAPGTYTVTLANQTDFPNTNLRALTSTYVDTVTITGTVNRPVRQIAQIYDDHCANCHGLRDRDSAGNLTLNVNPGEFSFLAKNKPFTEQDIDIALTTIPLMSNIDQLDGLNERKEMAAFIDTLVPNTVPQTGAQTYTAQCSRCHGRGDGAYAIGVMGATAAEIKQAIIDVPDMNTIPYDAASLKLLEDFLGNKVTLPGGNALLPQPLTGDGLYIMYCSYCHGLDGVGGPYVDDSIAGIALTGFMIISEIEKQDQKNMMGRIAGKINLDEAGLIAQTLNSKGPTPNADENDND
jgi:mono/diheme cytochrome c family protein